MEPDKKTEAPTIDEAKTSTVAPKPMKPKRRRDRFDLASLQPVPGETFHLKDFLGDDAKVQDTRVTGLAVYNTHFSMRRAKLMKAGTLSPVECSSQAQSYARRAINAYKLTIANDAN